MPVHSPASPSDGIGAERQESDDVAVPPAGDRHHVLRDDGSTRCGIDVDGAEIVAREETDRPRCEHCAENGGAGGPKTGLARRLDQVDSDAVSGDQEVSGA